MDNNLENIFCLKYFDNNKIVIQVLADDPFKVAMFPFVSSDWKYITVTRGKEHILTVVKDDGTTFDFHWGFSGHTLIGESLEMLKKNVLKFIDDSDILIEYNGGEIKEAKIYYNSNYNKWQLTLGTVDAVYWRSDIAQSLEEMIEDCKRFVISDTWEKTVAVTGIDVWTATNPIFTIF